MVDGVQDARQALGRRLASLRQAAGLSQHALAPLTHYGRSTIANVEVGRQNVPREFWERCDQVLSTGGELVRVHDALRQAVASSAALVDNDVAVSEPSETAGLETPFTILQRMQRASVASVDTATLDQLDALISQVVMDYETVGPQQLGPAVVRQRRWTQARLEERNPPRYSRRLYRVAAQLSGILATVASDLGQVPSARAYGAEAFQLAELADDPNVSGWVRATQSLVEYYATDYLAAARFATHGLSLAAGGPQTARLAINGQARAYARLGDRQGVARAVEVAQAHAVEFTGSQQVSPSLSLEAYCPTRLAGNAATAYLLLGDTEQVLAYGQAALRVFDQTPKKGARALTMLDMATALVTDRNPDPERAGQLVTAAVAIPGAAEFDSVMQRAQEFAAAAGPWHTQPTLRAATQEIRELVASSAGHGTTL